MNGTAHTQKSFSVPAAPTQAIPCPDGVHHYARGKCLRCDATEPTWRPAESQAFSDPRPPIPRTLPING